MSPPCVSERRKTLRKSFAAFVAFLTLAMAFCLWPLHADEWMAIYDLLFGDERNVAENSGHRIKSREYVFDISNLDLSEFEKADPHLVLLSDANSVATNGPDSGFAPDIGPLVGYGPGGVIPAGSPNQMGGNYNQFGDGDGSGDGGGPGGRRGSSPGFPFSPFFTNGGPPGSGGNPGNNGDNPNQPHTGDKPNSNNPNNNPQGPGGNGGGNPDSTKPTNNVHDEPPDGGPNGPTGPIVASLVVPEPASALTFAAGLMWLALFAYRRHSKPSSESGNTRA